MLGEKNPYDSELGQQYAQLEHTEPTTWLVLEDLPKLMAQHLAHKKRLPLLNKQSIQALKWQALDYGCGSGASTRFLAKCGYFVHGVDISASELMAAQQRPHPNIQYRHITSKWKNGGLQNSLSSYKPTCFDLVYSSFVFLILSSKAEIIAIFQEIYRVLKNDGIFVFVVASEHLCKYEWVSASNQRYPRNPLARSGKELQIDLRIPTPENPNAFLTVTDYYWTDTDYQNMLRAAGFNLLQAPHAPIADPHDTRAAWKAELQYPPYVAYIAEKM